MNIADLWRRFHDAKLREIAIRTAKQCEREIVALVGSRVRAMNPHQAKGYIKARAGLVVERRLRAGEGISLSPVRYARLEQIALETICQLVQLHLASSRLATAPVRKAA